MVFTSTTYRSWTSGTGTKKALPFGAGQTAASTGSAPRALLPSRDRFPRLGLLGSPAGSIETVLAPALDDHTRGCTATTCLELWNRPIAYEHTLSRIGVARDQQCCLPHHPSEQSIPRDTPSVSVAHLCHIGCLLAPTGGRFDAGRRGARHTDPSSSQST